MVSCTELVYPIFSSIGSLSFVGTDDMVVAKSALEGNALCVEAAVDYLLQISSSGRYCICNYCYNQS